MHSFIKTDLSTIWMGKEDHHSQVYSNKWLEEHQCQRALVVTYGGPHLVLKAPQAIVTALYQEPG